MALDKITSTMITDEAVTTAKLGPSAVTGAKIAADAIDISDLGTIMSVGETAPSSPFVGQRWYRASTAITYQYTNDGTSSFWLDVSSGGIGTSASRSVDYVGDADPFPNHNGGSATLSVGQVYYNREKNRHFVCTTATTDANVWSGRFAGIGGIQTAHTVGSNHYKIHTFLSSGTFYMDSATTCDYLVIAGGGGGDGGTAYAGGGGGAGGFRTGTGLAVTAQAHTITVGDGGAVGANGSNSVFSTITSTGGGYGGRGTRTAGAAGGSGGGGAYSAGSGGAGIYDAGESLGHVLHQGRDGGDNQDGHGVSAGGGGASAEGTNNSTSTPGVGGAGEDQVMGLSAADSYTLLGNASAGHDSGGARYFSGGGAGGRSVETPGGVGGVGGGGTGGVQSGTAPVAGTANTGGGGGGGGSNYQVGAAGGSGIVIIRYLIA